jgi:hypothetical protein
MSHLGQDALVLGCATRHSNRVNPSFISSVCPTLIECSTACNTESKAKEHLNEKIPNEGVTLTQVLKLWIGSEAQQRTIHMVHQCL